jgi:ABC-type multidrug transport system ATPase subunit
MIKGISGGERKRTSIGYELITDPNLLLCDEPTSGLDSTTSLKICKMLKNEALTQGTTIICTIHQPSAEIFNTFDRLLLLHDGFEIYQGPINSELTAYLSKHLGCNMPKFTNPADYIIKMAQAPYLCNERLTLAGMVNKYYKVMKPQLKQGTSDRTSRYTAISTNFEDFAEKRGQGFCTQFT